MKALTLLAVLGCLPFAVHASTIVDTGYGFAALLQTQAGGSNTQSPAIIVNSPGTTYSANQTTSGAGTGSASDSLSTVNGNIELHGSASGGAPSNPSGEFK
jgi:hypothetical protein